MAAAVKIPSLHIVFLLSFIVRIFLMCSPLKEFIASHKSIVTPLTSWNRLQEGLAMLDYGISPYSGGLVHETPLALLAFHFIQCLYAKIVPFVFVGLDLLTGVLLYHAAKLHSQTLMQEQEKEKEKYAENVGPILIKEEYLTKVPNLVLMVYLLNPYSVASCIAQSTLILNHFSIALALLFALNGNPAISTLGIALATYQSFYPLMLLVPLTMILIKFSSWRLKTKTGKFLVVLKILLLFVFWLGFLFTLSYYVFMSWDYVWATHGFILSVPDLAPNVGLFWYFFTEMFEHFRIFFLAVFQINAFFYTLPLAIRLRNQPVFLLYILCSIISVFKSYPSFGDFSLPLALLLMWSHVFPYLRNTLPLVCMFASCTVLAPVLWHLWIYAGSANANFYYAVTLAYSTAQIFLVSDVFYSVLRREYDLKNGIYPTVIDGVPQQVIFR